MIEYGTFYSKFSKNVYKYNIQNFDSFTDHTE